MIQPSIISEQRQEARRKIVQQVEQGTLAKIARVCSPVPMHRTTVYRLLKRVQSEGEKAFTDGRHGHPVKLRGDVLADLRKQCQENPSLPSAVVQRMMYERFGQAPSVSQLNRVRARLCLSRQPIPHEKKAQNWPRELNQDITNRSVACCSWPQPPRLDCSPGWVKHCQQQ